LLLFSFHHFKNTDRVELFVITDMTSSTTNNNNNKAIFNDAEVRLKMRG